MSGDGEWVESFPLGWGWAMGGKVVERGGWGMAPLLPLGWGWAMAVVFDQDLDREGCVCAVRIECRMVPS